MPPLLSKADVDSVAQRIWADWGRAATTHNDFMSLFEMAFKFVAPDRLGTYSGNARESYSQI